MSVYSRYSSLYPDVVANLENARRSGRLAHAFLISSTSETIRNEFATVVSQIAGCPEFLTAGRVVDDCECCSKLERGVYSELHTLSPVGKMYQIQVGNRDNPAPNTIRDFINSFQLTSWQSGWRKIGIIYDCDRMGKEAQNALLKTLEEPPADTTLILVTGNPSSLLPTTRSRCQQIVLPSDGLQYDFPGAEQLFSALYDTCFTANDLLTAEKAASEIILIASSLLERAKQTENEKFETMIKTAKQMEDNSMVKRLEERLNNMIFGAYMRERRSFLSAISCFCFQVFMLSQGIAFDELPNKEVFGETAPPAVSEEKASKILAEAETLVSTLNYNVNEELAIRAFVLNIVF
ncbi:MAG: hypothetical protein IJC21_06740 [Lentisphaeria bacterium]|nr:hypothetical protein [Lentisphaeria bacterium]